MAAPDPEWSPYAGATHHDLSQPLLDGQESDSFGVLGEWQQKGLQHLGWPRSSPTSCDCELQNRADSKFPCTKIPYFQTQKNQLRGSPVLELIEEACGATNVSDILDPVAPPEGDTLAADLWEAVYEPFDNTSDNTIKEKTKVKIKIHAVHLAASLGSIEVLEWLQNHCSPDVLCYRSIIETTKVWEENGRIKRESARNMHYSPLLAALYMSQIETAIWILEQVPATASLVNADGMSPLHMIAWTALPSVAAELRNAALERVAHTVVDKKANLLQKVSHLPGDHPFAKQVRCKTPLQIAVGIESSFPKELLHLLTQSYHFPTQSQLFVEVNTIAKENPYAAVQLLGKVKELAPNQVEEGLRAESRTYEQDLSHPDRHIEMFVETLRMSPIAAAKLLDLLMGEPRVTKPQRYNLPLYTVLPNRELICTYQPPEGSNDLPVWEEIEPGVAPEWHKEFRRELPNDALLHTHVYEVKVKVLYFSDILKLKVASILSMVWNSWDNMKVFAQIPIKAVVLGLWNRHAHVWYFCMLWATVLLAAIIAVGLQLACPFGCDADLLIGSIIVANILFEGANLVYGFAFCRCAEIPKMTYVYNFAIFTMVNWLALIVLVLAMTKYPVNTPEAKVLAAVNLLLRCFWMILEVRVFPVVGPLIIAVLQSFAPMIGMFAFMGMMFFTFALTFLIMKDDERSIPYVLLNLYQALLLTDGNGAQAISGMDIGHEQSLDIGVEMYTGGGNQWLLQATTICMLFATSSFSLVLLNLTIGMYTKFYEEKEQLAKLAFQQCRARASVILMLRPTLPSSLLAFMGRAGFSPSKARWACGLAALPFFILSLVLVFWHSNPIPEATFFSISLAGFFLSVALLVLQASLLIDISDLDHRHRYLWVSYRSDYSDHFEMNQDLELSALKSELCGEVSRQRDEIARLSKELRNIEVHLKKANEMLRLTIGTESRCSPQ